MDKDGDVRLVAKPGEVIFSEGEVGKAAYLIEDGQVEISKMIEGRRVVLGRVEQGGVFGEMALIDNTSRMATAIATMKTELMIMSEDTFRTKLERSDPFIRSLLRIFAQNIRTSARAGRVRESGPSPSAIDPKELAWFVEL